MGSININSPWSLCIIGIIFCISGIWLFYTHAFEENRRIVKPVLVMIAGVVLIALGMAKEYHLID
jgi:hypothetical protein